MIRCILRFLLPALIAFLAACSSLSLPPGSNPEEQRLFLLAIEEPEAAASAKAVETLRQNYPDSEWTTKAGEFAALKHSRESLQARVQTLQQEKNRLLQENRKLKEDMDKLKKLVIEMEKRRK